MNARIAIFGLMAAVMMALPGSARHRGSDVQDINEGRAIRFEHTLPAMHITTPPNGTYNNYELGYPGVLTTSDPDLGLMLWKLRTSIWADRHMVLVDGKTLVTYKNWIRDHVHVMKGFCHWEYDLRSFLDFIIDTQREDGCYYELLKQIDDEHWSYVDEQEYEFYPEDNLALVRLEIEADIEYLVVEGAMDYFRVSGDRAWLRRVLPRLEKGIEYVCSDSDRWDGEHGLVKRGYTIDTWDFTNTPDAGTNRRIQPGVTPMAIMHGDNSGVYQAMNQLAWMHRKLGHARKARRWEARAQELRANMYRHLWNGRFFVHQLPLGCPAYDGNEESRLSLSNAYDINRGVTDLEQAGSIIREYQTRRDTTSAFAEWFSIDPPYEKFYIYKPGRYVNGAISPFTAGELAKAAFNNGYEKYGWDIIRRFEEMMQRDGTIYFLYSPVTGQSESKGAGPSAWGAAALMSAIDEGLAGVVDKGCGYDEILFCPRWVVTHYTELRYITGYEAAGKQVDVRYICTGQGMRYRVQSPARHIQGHILLPDGKTCTELRINGEKRHFTISEINESRYADFSAKADGLADIELIF